MGYWLATATYEDGFEIEKKFPYAENDNYAKEEAKIYDIECWLATFANEHGSWTDYGVNYVAE